MYKHLYKVCSNESEAKSVMDKLSSLDIGYSFSSGLMKDPNGVTQTGYYIYISKMDVIRTTLIGRLFRTVFGSLDYVVMGLVLLSFLCSIPYCNSPSESQESINQEKTDTVSAAPAIDNASGIVTEKVDISKAIPPTSNQPIHQVSPSASPIKPPKIVTPRIPARVATKVNPTADIQKNNEMKDTVSP